MLDNVMYSVVKWKANKTIDNVSKDLFGDQEAEKKKKEKKPNVFQSFASSIQEKVEDFTADQEKKRFLKKKKKEREKEKKQEKKK